MPFQKGHKLGAKKQLKKPLDKQVIAFRGYEGQKEKLKAIPNWQERFREFVDQLYSSLLKDEQG
ncbi:MAG: hypothetical protein RIM23_12630 [Coleofasciculus sp. G3-WIS-01]|uniref:hypothetical protein n=1 Tax=Coleofasciculus sp. G3-WIS-01 TaxID=3069528 RepID=UPI0032F4B5CA